MAPAEIGIFKFGEGPSEDKVHSGQRKTFAIGDIKAEVFDHLGVTYVEAKGENLRYVVGERFGPIQTEGSFANGYVKVSLQGEQQSITINEIGVGSSLTITHTKHDGSAGEVG